MKNGYAVVWTGNGPGTAEVQSYHRTQAAAEKRAVPRGTHRSPTQLGSARGREERSRLRSGRILPAVRRRPHDQRRTPSAYI